ncbi:MAG: hypothetical protein F6K19_05155 [Cyanothece sp. SIO1E1]|nr:hypothetical protein [Cyanothece sp. SIO1E1]
MTDKAYKHKYHSRPAHLELTPKEVFELWKEGHYTAKGYLYHLLLAHKKAGWWFRVNSVSDFCKKWGINRRTFYKAKAALIIDGKLEESIMGAIDLRIPDISINTCAPEGTLENSKAQVENSGAHIENSGAHIENSGAHIENSGAHIENSGAHIENSGAHMTAGMQSGKEPYNSSDLDQIYSDLSQSQPTTQEREKNKNSSEKLDPEFREWLLKKAQKLPEKPEFLDRWIEVQAAKGSIKKQFEEERNKRTQIKTSASPPEQFQIEYACLSAIQSGDRPFASAKLIQLWSDGWQELVKTLVSTHPEWGFAVSESGPVEVEVVI